MSRLTITTITVRGEDYPVDVSAWQPHSGRSGRGGTPTASFSAEVNGESLSAPTLEALYEAMMRATKRAAIKVAIEATLSETLEPVVLTGVHGGSRNILYTDRRGRSQQDTGYGEHYLRRLSEEEVAELRRLRAEEKAARLACGAYEKERALDARAVVAGAVDERIAAAERAGEAL